MHSLQKMPSKEMGPKENLFKERIEKRYFLIEKTLSDLIPLEHPLHEEIFSAARYSLLAGGKRMRPLLALITAEMLGCNDQKAMVAACTLELIHTYSLIHDDLPCMDNDDFRRGKPSLHKAYQEGLALLTGDYLLTYAFDLLANLEEIRDDQKLALIASLSKNCGAYGMIGGQVMDILSQHKEIDLNLLKEIHTRKTGMLIGTALEFGAIMGDAPESEKALLRQFGLDIGLGFQIIDDILDVTASKEKHGKEVPSDLINGKTTYVSLLGITKAQDLARSITEKALESLRKLPYDIELLTFLAESLVTRKI